MTPFEQLGGADRVRALVERFYDVMSEREPALARLHRCDPDGKVDRGSRDRFALFLIGWLGGPQDYIEQHGHPRLRMRHFPFRIAERERDEWLWCMDRALDEHPMPDETRAFLRERFHGLADHMRNQAD